VDLHLEPSAGYPSLGGACKAIERIMAERLAVGIKRADSVTYENEFVRARRTGCELIARGTFNVTSTDSTGSRDIGGSLADGLSGAGWVDIPRYTADGPDGSIFGMRSRETVCIIRGSWDGGDDSDSTYVPSPEWEFVAHCAPQEPGDSL
jgi:hypothetical protein